MQQKLSSLDTTPFRYPIYGFAMSGQSQRDMDVADRFNQHLRRESKKPKSQVSQVQCPACSQVFPPSSKATAFEKHYLEAHAQLLEPTSTAAENSRILANLWDAAARIQSTERYITSLLRLVRQRNKKCATEETREN